MNYAFNELFDQSKIEELMVSFFKLTGIPSAIVDIKGNSVLKAGWKKICTDDQGQDLDENRTCYQCQLSMMGSLVLENQPYVIKKCAHGIIVTGVPIRVQGVPIAILMFSQILVDTPELQYFGKHPEIQINSQQKLDLMLDYFQKVAEMLGEMAFKRLNLVKEQQNELLREKQRLKIIFDRITNVGIQIYSEEGKILYWNPVSEELFGWSSAEAIGKTLEQLMFGVETHQDLLENFEKVRQGIQLNPNNGRVKINRETSGLFSQRSFPFLKRNAMNIFAWILIFLNTINLKKN